MSKFISVILLLVGAVFMWPVVAFIFEIHNAGADRMFAASMISMLCLIVGSSGLAL